MNKILTALLCVLCLGPGAAAAAAVEELVVYTAVETELLGPYEKAFNLRHPEIKIRWVRDSAGPIASRLMAEKDAPRADVVFGLSADAVMELIPHGLFEPYKPAGFDAISPLMRDNKEHLWIAFNAWPASFCVNIKELERLKLPEPKSWADLLRPEYKGHIVMPNPVSSGTGHMFVYGWIAAWGEEKAWQYMAELDKNIKMYVHSGSRPAQMAAQGEAAIGLSSSTYALPFIRRKAPLRAVNPVDGVFWSMEASALIKGAKNPSGAKKMIDFSTSREAAEIAADNLYITGRKLEREVDPSLRLEGLMPIDFEAKARTRSEVLTQWRLRFDR
jgi:iron(III) transport system substrate-binding protein